MVPLVVADTVIREVNTAQTAVVQFKPIATAAGWIAVIINFADNDLCFDTVSSEISLKSAISCYIRCETIIIKWRFIELLDKS